METPIAPTPQTADLLEQLRDIGMPEMVSWWPPAPGWWLVAALLGIVSFFAVRFLRRRWLENAYRNEARQLLKDLHASWFESHDDGAFATGAHQILRRVVIHHAGREQAARLTGQAFLERANLLSTAPLSRETGSLLTERSYQPKVEFDVEPVGREIEAWLEGLERKRHA